MNHAGSVLVPAPRSIHRPSSLPGQVRRVALAVRGWIVAGAPFVLGGALVLFADSKFRPEVVPGNALMIAGMLIAAAGLARLSLRAAGDEEADLEV
jgi:hypothetical protein